MKLAVAASIVAVCFISCIGIASVLNSFTSDETNRQQPSELIDIDMGNSGSGLDFGLSIPKPTLSADELKQLRKYEKTRSKLLNVIRNLEQKMAGVRRPVVDVRIASLGPKGLPGPVGPPGVTGPRGLPGTIGQRGATGSPGPQGRLGPQGLQGPPGPPGLAGARGPPGPNGPRGQRGQRGDRGPAGARGRPGRVGARGPPGPIGPRGDMGPRGHRGKRGAPGPTGDIGAPPPEPGTVSGRIVNVMNGASLTGVTLRVLQNGEIVQNVVVSRTGEYTVRLDPGEYQLQGEANGFIRFTRTITVTPGQTSTSRIFMSPALQTGQLRVVLTWNKLVPDLDLHLDTPSGCSVGWNNRECNSAAAESNLDHDDTNGEGPETITISKLQPGTYKVWVHRYSSGNFLTTEATVRVFYPSGELRVFRIGSDGVIAAEDKWDVVTIDGATGQIFGPVMEGTKWVVVPGTPATFSSISTSQSGLNVWGASQGVVYRRTGITDAVKMGTAWSSVPGATAVGVAAADLGVWVWDETGAIFARNGVSALSQEGTEWLRVESLPSSLYTVSFDGANAVATTTDGRVWWRAGIVPSNPVGTRWFQVPGRMTDVSVYSSNLWGVRHGKIFRRINMQQSPPAGTGWEEVPGMASDVAVSNGAVWTVTESGAVFFRKGINPNEPAGESWGEVTGDVRVKSVSVGNGVVWGLDTTSSPVFRDGVARTGGV